MSKEQYWVNYNLDWSLNCLEVVWFKNAFENNFEIDGLCYWIIIFHI